MPMRSGITARIAPLTPLFAPKPTLRTCFDDFVLDNQLGTKTSILLEDPSLALQLAEEGAGERP